MSTTADEDLDRRLRRPRALSGEPMDDGVLLAYLAGSLDPSAVEEIDAALAQSGVARAQLRALADARTALTDIDFAAAEAALPGTARRRWPIWAGAGLAAAAALLFWIMRPTTPDVAWRMDGPRGGVQAARAEKTESLVFVPQSELTIDLVPDGTVEPQAIKAYVAESGTLRLRVVTTTRSPAGAVQVRATAKSLFKEGYGPRTLWLVLGDDAGLEGAPVDTIEQRDRPTFRVEVDYRATVAPNR